MGEPLRIGGSGVGLEAQSTLERRKIREVCTNAKWTHENDDSA